MMTAKFNLKISYLIFFLVFFSFACNLPANRSNPKPSPTFPPLPTIKAPVVTSAPLPTVSSTRSGFPTLPSLAQATPTQVIPIPQPKPTQAVPSNIILQDDFTDPAVNGWPTDQVDDEFANITRAFTNGKYRWTIRSKQGLTSNVTPKMDPVGDLKISVDIQLISGQKERIRGGVIIRKVDSKNYYYIGFSETGNVAVYLRADGQWQNLLSSPVTSTAIRSGSPNRLTVIAKGASFTVQINQQPVLQFTDNRLTSGIISLITEIFEPNLDAVIEFDNLDIQKQ